MRHTATPAVICRLTAERDDAQRERAKLAGENASLRSHLDAARKAGYLTPEEKTAAHDGIPYAPAKYKAAMAGVAWSDAGEAAAKMVPLLQKLAADFVAGKPVDEKIGIEIFKWNQKLQNVAVTAIAAKVPGEEGNGAFTHPVVAINLIHAALAEAGVPLDEGQVKSLRDIGDRFIEADARRMTGYDEETFALQKTIDECALKDTMFAAIDAVLTPGQQDVLHPASIRERTGIDLYSSGTIWYVVARAVDFRTRADLAPGLVQQYLTRGNLTEEQKALLGSAARDWAESFSAAFLDASADPVAQTSRRSAAGGALAGWQKLTQVRTAAIHQLALNRALFELVGSDTKTAAQIRADRRVFVPLRKP